MHANTHAALTLRSKRTHPDVEDSCRATVRIFILTNICYSYTVNSVKHYLYTMYMRVLFCISYILLFYCIVYSFTTIIVYYNTTDLWLL